MQIFELEMDWKNMNLCLFSYKLIRCISTKRIWGSFKVCLTIQVNRMKIKKKEHNLLHKHSRMSSVRRCSSLRKKLFPFWITCLRTKSVFSLTAGLTFLSRRIRCSRIFVHCSLLSCVSSEKKNIILLLV